MRTFVTITIGTAIAAGLLLASSPAQAATGTPARPTGAVITDVFSTNDGDNGWGNCGHNSSGGLPPTGQLSPTRGNGGYRPGDICLADADGYRTTTPGTTTSLTMATTTTNVDPSQQPGYDPTISAY